MYFKDFYLEMLFYISKLSYLPEKTDPKKFYLEESPIYFYIGNPKDYDFDNDYDYVTLCKFKNGKIYDTEMAKPGFLSMDISPDTKIHVFIDIYPYKDDVYKLFHKTKIYYASEFCCKFMNSEILKVKV